MNVMERYIENYCDQFCECEVAYYIEADDFDEFYYDMHKQYNHEMLITAPINSIQIVEFLDGLNKIFSPNDNVYWTENWGEESGADCDRIWIWW